MKIILKFIDAFGPKVIRFQYYPELECFYVYEKQIDRYKYV